MSLHIDHQAKPSGLSPPPNPLKSKWKLEGRENHGVYPSEFS